MNSTGNKTPRLQPHLGEDGKYGLRRGEAAEAWMCSPSTDTFLSMRVRRCFSFCCPAEYSASRRASRVFSVSREVSVEGERLMGHPEDLYFFFVYLETYGSSDSYVKLPLRV